MSTSPAERAASVVGAIGVVRNGRDACERHARHLRTGRVMQLDALALTHGLPDTSAAPLASSPGELSDRLLTVLFGTRPVEQTTVAGTHSRRKAGVVVREVGWDEWTAAAEGSGAAPIADGRD